MHDAVAVDVVAVVVVVAVAAAVDVVAVVVAVFVTFDKVIFDGEAQSFFLLKQQRLSLSQAKTRILPSSHLSSDCFSSIILFLSSAKTRFSGFQVLQCGLQ